MAAFTPKPPTSPSEKTNTSSNQSTKPESSPKITHLDASHWPTLCAQLPLSGLSRALADNCAFVGQDDQTVHLELDASHRALAQPKYENRLAETLSDYYNYKVCVKISITNGVKHTPHQVRQRQLEEQQTALERSITEDQNVQRIMNAFGAEVVKESIQAND